MSDEYIQLNLQFINISEHLTEFNLSSMMIAAFVYIWCLYICYSIYTVATAVLCIYIHNIEYNTCKLFIEYWSIPKIYCCMKFLIFISAALDCFFLDCRERLLRPNVDGISCKLLAFFLGVKLKKSDVVIYTTSVSGEISYMFNSLKRK